MMPPARRHPAGGARPAAGTARSPGRAATGLGAALLLGLGLLLPRLLIANPSDNAYLGLWLVGQLLRVAALC